MPLQELSSTQEIVERSFYERIMGAIAEYGYGVDKNHYAKQGEAGLRQWQQAMEAVRLKKKFAIEVFGMASSQERDTKKTPRFVIQQVGYMPGTIGFDESPQFVRKDPTTYTKQRLPAQMVDMYINIHLLASNVKEMRVMIALLAKALPTRGYIKKYNVAAFEDSGNLFVRRIMTTPDDSPYQGIIERVYRYEVPDLTEESILDEGDTPQIEEIDLNINVKKGAAGDIDDTDTDHIETTTYTT